MTDQLIQALPFLVLVGGVVLATPVLLGVGLYQQTDHYRFRRMRRRHARALRQRAA